MIFLWQASDSQGQKHHGSLEGDNERAVRQHLREQGLRPISVKPKKNIKTFTSAISTKRVTLNHSELALFTRQLSTLVSAALPLEEAIGVIAKQNKSSKLGLILMQLRERILAGHTLSDALSGYPKVFDNIYRTLVKAGEKSGQLAVVLEKLADYNEAKQQIRSKLTQALVYPTMLTSVAVIVIAILLTTVVPKVVEQFIHMKHQLPLTTRSLLAISDALRSYGLYFCAIVLVTSITFKYWKRKPENLHRFHKALLNFPLCKALIRAINCARYLRTLSILQSSGVPLLDGMGIAIEGINNHEIRYRLLDAADSVRQGGSFHSSLDRTGLFPPMMLYMIASGEKSGQLSNLMERAADNQDKLLQSRITITLALFEPALIITMAVVVLFIVTAVMQPILQLNSLIS